MDLKNEMDFAGKFIGNDIIGVLNKLIDYKELIMAYDCAIREIKTKVDILDSEFKLKYNRNPISTVHTRLKSDVSIFNKLKKKNLDITKENIENNIKDIAGVRIVCYYIDDIYRIAAALVRQNDVEVLNVKDYIGNPKENGYRSLHLIVTVPVFFSDETKNVPVEIQIRTIAMDFWASLEHQMKYKSNEIDNSDRIVAELKACSEDIFATDKKMQAIRIDIEDRKTDDSDEDVIIEKLKRLTSE